MGLSEKKRWLVARVCFWVAWLFLEWFVWSAFWSLIQKTYPRNDTLQLVASAGSGLTTQTQLSCRLGRAGWMLGWTNFTTWPAKQLQWQVPFGVQPWPVGWALFFCVRRIVFDVRKFWFFHFFPAWLFKWAVVDFSVCSLMVSMPFRCILAGV